MLFFVALVVLLVEWPTEGKSAGCRNKANNGDGRDEKRRKMRLMRRTDRELAVKKCVFFLITINGSGLRCKK
ncbi:hypothetical protein ASG81_22370 [Paenibacillus sp. Soil522]|nr:hypothetical protein ASG81_22370 [Paenibacillus sp. Soil522]